ncbi:MAG: YceI family protein [Myxococcota bacterium]
MPILEPPTVSCVVYAFKEGLLSAVGHDVKLAVNVWKLETDDGGTLVATFDPKTLAVVAAMKDGAENPSALSDKDKRTIEGYVRDDILEARRFPQIRFTATGVEPDDDGTGFVIAGDLLLHGRTRSITVAVRRKADRWVSRVKVNQVDFGITPFRAMLGALRIQATIEVEVEVPASVPLS